MVSYGKLYYLEDLELGDVVRCRTGCFWLSVGRACAQLGDASGLEATFLGGNGEDFFLLDHEHGKVLHVIDHHHEATRWEILGEDN